jgi:hypothetical protein
MIAMLNIPLEIASTFLKNARCNTQQPSGTVTKNSAIYT